MRLETRAWFNANLGGSLVMLALSVLLFVLTAIGVSLMVSSLSHTLQQALLGVFLFMVPTVILSGFATPVANMPTIVRWLTCINPPRYFLVVVRGIFLGPPWPDC